MNEMNCTICQQCLDGYADNELDTTIAMRVAAHLAHCEGCQRRYEEIKSLTVNIKSHSPYYEAPTSFAKNIMHAINAEESSGWLHAVRKNYQTWFAPAFSLAALAAALLFYVITPSEEDLWVDETVSSHVRSLMEQHLNDVQSSDRHTVKPWFTGKLDFSPPVHDFTAQGFPLLGGRLDYLQHQTVAALTYRHDKHIINVFIFPDAHADSASVNMSKRGYNILVWHKNHMEFRAVSDLNATELKILSQLILQEISL